MTRRTFEFLFFSLSFLDDDEDDDNDESLRSYLILCLSIYLSLSLVISHEVVNEKKNFLKLSRKVISSMSSYEFPLLSQLSLLLLNKNESQRRASIN